MRHLAVLALVFALPGCAATYTEPALPPDHPARASAPEAPAPPGADMLEPARESPGAAGDHDHGGPR